MGLEMINGLLLLYCKYYRRYVSRGDVITVSFIRCTFSIERSSENTKCYSAPSPRCYLIRLMRLDNVLNSLRLYGPHGKANEKEKRRFLSWK